MMKKPMEEPVLVRKPVSDGVLERVNGRQHGKHGWHSLIWNNSWYWMVVAWTYLVHLRTGGDPVVSWKHQEGHSWGRSAKCEDRSLSLLSRWWYILHYHRSTLLLPLGERLLLVVVERKREVK